MPQIQSNQRHTYLSRRLPPPAAALSVVAAAMVGSRVVGRSGVLTVGTGVGAVVPRLGFVCVFVLGWMDRAGVSGA